MDEEKVDTQIEPQVPPLETITKLVVDKFNGQTTYFDKEHQKVFGYTDYDAVNDVIKGLGIDSRRLLGGLVSQTKLTPQEVERHTTFLEPLVEDPQTDSWDNFLNYLSSSIVLAETAIKYPEVVEETGKRIEEHP